MSYEARVLAFAERFLSDRTFQLIVLPAVADLQFENRQGSLSRTASRVAVIRAVAGGLRDELARDSLSFVMLTLMPAAYYIFALVLCFDFRAIPLSTGFFGAAMLILILSIGQALICFWPGRPTPRSAD